METMINSSNRIDRQNRILSSWSNSMRVSDLCLQVILPYTPDSFLCLRSPYAIGKAAS